jgi:hypothetical protein
MRKYYIVCTADGFTNWSRGYRTFREAKAIADALDQGAPRCGPHRAQAHDLRVVFDYELRIEDIWS